MVNQQNKVEVKYTSVNDFIDNLNVLFEELDIRNSSVIEAPLIKLMKPTMTTFE